MLKVTFTEKGRKLSLRLEGHAGYAEHGKDVVCASASILAYTLASIVGSFDDVKANIEIASGDALIECECESDETFNKVLDAFHYTQTGYTLLAQHNPQYVRLYALT